MSSSTPDNKVTKGLPQWPAQKTSDDALVDASLDLDKNPIKYATSEPGVTTEDAHDKDYMELTLRSGKHSPLVQKILRQRIEARAKEFPRWPGEDTTGVRLMWIESRFWYDRARFAPDFDDEWRKYRARYLHSLELHPNEPYHVPEYEKILLNPIRRSYMKIGDFIEDKIIKKFIKNPYQSAVWRFGISRGFMIYIGCMLGYNLLRYNIRTWDDVSGPMVSQSRPVKYPDDPRFPGVDPRTEPQHHCDFGFTRRKVFKDLRDFDDSTTII